MSILRNAARSFLLLFAVLAPPMQGATVFNFDADVGGKGTAFTDTVSGLGATFSSSGDPSGFIVTTGFFSGLTGNVLLDPGPGGANNLTLTILFTALQTSISMNFAENAASGVLFTLNAFNNASAVGSASVAGVVPSGFSFPEGIISFSGSPFNRVVLSSPGLDFAIDNVSVNAGATVPEPSTLLLALAALGALTIGRVRIGRRRFGQ